MTVTWGVTQWPSKAEAIDAFALLAWAHPWGQPGGRATPVLSYWGWGWGWGGGCLQSVVSPGSWSKLASLFLSFFFKLYFPITVDIQYHFRFVSGVEHRVLDSYIIYKATPLIILVPTWPHT